MTETCVRFQLGRVFSDSGFARTARFTSRTPALPGVSSAGVARSNSALLVYGALLLHAIHEAWGDGSGHRLETRAVRVQMIARATHGRIRVKGWQ